MQLCSSRFVAQTKAAFIVYFTIISFTHARAPGQSDHTNCLCRLYPYFWHGHTTSIALHDIRAFPHRTLLVVHVYGERPPRLIRAGAKASAAVKAGSSPWAAARYLRTLGHRVTVRHNVKKFGSVSENVLPPPQSRVLCKRQRQHQKRQKDKQNNTPPCRSSSVGLFATEPCSGVRCRRRHAYCWYSCRVHLQGRARSRA